MKRKYDNYVSAVPPRLPPAPPQHGASVFVAAAVILLVILGVLVIGTVGIIGSWQDWTLRTTVLACLAAWGATSLPLLPWLLDRIFPEVAENFWDSDDGG